MRDGSNLAGKGEGTLTDPRDEHSLCDDLIALRKNAIKLLSDLTEVRIINL